MKTKLFFWLVLLTACGDDNLPKYTLLDRFRVLALEADTPEVSPGATVTITPYLSDPGGSGRSISYSVESCVDLGVNLGATPTCDGNPSRVVVVMGGTQAAPGTAPHYTGTTGTIGIAVPSSAVIFTDPRTGGVRTTNEQYNGVNYLMIYRATAGSETVSAFKRIVVSSRTTKNANPSLTEIQFNGVTAASAAAPAAPNKVRLDASVGGGSTEIYSYRDSDGVLANRSEELLVSWFVTQGSLLRSRTDAGESNEYTPSDAPLSATTTFVAVLRDDRGGTSVRTITK